MTFLVYYRFSTSNYFRKDNCKISYSIKNIFGFQNSSLLLYLPQNISMFKHLFIYQSYLKTDCSILAYMVPLINSLLRGHPLIASTSFITFQPFPHHTSVVL